jgi:arylsulfatase A
MHVRYCRAFAICILNVILLAFTTPAEAPAKASRSERPNIVYILADDLGYGDVHSLNPARGKIRTPHIDNLIAKGMSFTDAHSGSSVCTPTRYGIMTGRYSWRTRLQKGVQEGIDPPLIAPDRLTVASLLRNHGYATAIIGKWHLGIEFGKDRWKDPFLDGPLQHGFDYFFGTCASLDAPPYGYLENQRFIMPPSVELRGQLNGPASKNYEAINVLSDITHRGVAYIAAQNASASHTRDRAKPFFLYLPLTAPHTIIIPAPEWQGKSGLGPYGDYVMQTDGAVGEILQALDAAHLTDNTLVIFTSDNGPCPIPEIIGLQAKGHYTSGDFRGYKSDIWEGGHRIPFVARWPGAIQPASHSSALICLSDLLATCADIVGYPLPDHAAEDSRSILPILTQKSAAPVHEAIVHHSIDGMFAIRRGKWKLILCAGSGGWSAPQERQAVQNNLPGK